MDGIFVHRNFIQTFGKYFDSTVNVVCQIEGNSVPRFSAKAVAKLLGFFPKEEPLS